MKIEEMTIDQLQACLSVIIDILSATDEDNITMCLHIKWAAHDIFDAMNRLEAEQLLDKYIKEDMKNEYIR